MAIIYVRTIIIYLALVAAMRLMGKRQLGELELSELVIAVLISDIAANPLQDIEIPLLNGLIPIGILIGCELLMTLGIVKSHRFRALVCGKPSILIANGVIDQKEMRANRFTLDELCKELRCQGISELSQVKYAVLETNGSLSVLLFPAEAPPTAAALGIPCEDKGYSTILINDGRVLSENLRQIGRDEGWLKKELKRHGVTLPREVYFMARNEAGDIYFQKKEGRA